MLTRLRRALEPIAALAACLAGAVLLRLPALTMPLDRDASVYATIGRSLGSALPYRDVIDHKQPGVYPVYWILDLVAPRSDLAIRLASAYAAGLAAWLLYLALRGRIGRPRAAVAAGLAVVLGASRYVQGFELNTEHLLLLTGTLLVVSALALERSTRAWAPLLVGVLLGVAVLTKAVGILFAPAALAPLLLGRPDRGRTLLRFAAGAALPLLLVGALYVAHGALGDLWTWNWTYNREYASVLSLSQRIDGLKLWPADLLLIAVTTLAALIWLRVRGVRDTLALTLVLWFAGAVIGALLGGYGYAHYYAPMVIPAAALLVVPLRARLLAVAFPVVASAAFVVDLGRSAGESGRAFGVRTYGEQARVWSAYEPVARVLEAHARPGDRLYVAGNEAGFYWRADLRPASRLLYDSPLNLRPELATELTRALCAHPPRFVVLPLGALPPYAACLGEAGYRPLATVAPAVSVLERG